MATAPPPAPSPGLPPARLRSALDALVAESPAARVQADPLAFVRRYADPGDQEVAAVFASGLAYGRVAAFWPVLEGVFATADAAGGPRAWVLDGDPWAVGHLSYRWMRGGDLALLAATLGEALRRWDRLGSVAEDAFSPGQPDIGPALDALVDALRDCALAVAPALLGTPAGTWRDLPRGFRYFLPRPGDGSACKRWCMALRWLCRPPGDPARVDGLDLGLWSLPSSHLVMPLDTHVARLGWLLGLTRRTDGSWRTARALTDALRSLDPDDPLRFDFALAHLGISGRCTVRRSGDRPPAPAVCAACPLCPLCAVGSRRAQPPGVTG